MYNLVTRWAHRAVTVRAFQVVTRSSDYISQVAKPTSDLRFCYPVNENPGSSTFKRCRILMPNRRLAGIRSADGKYIGGGTGLISWVRHPKLPNFGALVRL